MSGIDLPAVMAATWPPVATRRDGPWLVREGRGGGSRVSAASAIGPVAGADVPVAEQAMRAMAQEPLFQLWPQQQAVDDLLAARGYRVMDPVVIYAAATAVLSEPAPEPLAAFTVWPPLAIANAIWTGAGTGAARLAIMGRVAGPKVVVLGRSGGRSAGVAFVAVHHTVAMLHALEVVPALRRRGVAVQMLRKAAGWARDQGADQLCLAVTAANVPARGLYGALGMAVVDRYHYRQK